MPPHAVHRQMHRYFVEQHSLHVLSCQPCQEALYLPSRYVHFRLDRWMMWSQCPV